MFKFQIELAVLSVSHAVAMRVCSAISAFAESDTGLSFDRSRVRPAAANAGQTESITTQRHPKVEGGEGGGEGEANKAGRRWKERWLLF